MISITPKLPFSKFTEHTDDILCSDLYMNLLVTGSYDGEILVWSVDNTKLLFPLRRKSEITAKTDCSIDKLYFIKNRVYNGLNSIVLLSSSSGYITFWTLSIDKDKRNYGKFNTKENFNSIKT